MNVPHHYRLKRAHWHISQQCLQIFLEHLPAASRRVLMLDYDGTLAPFTANRDEARPYPGIEGLLTELEEDPRNRLVLVTGRKVADLHRLMPLSCGLEVWGCHGWERQLPGEEAAMLPLPDDAQEALTQGHSRLADLASSLEVKPTSLALHWRGAEKAEQTSRCNQALEAWTPLTHETGLEIHRFDGGLELRCQGRTKGHVVDDVLAEEQDGVLAAYLGDDLTDEDAFRALRENGGRGLSVLVRSDYRETAAEAWLRPPGELVLFLECWRTHS